MPVVSFLRNLEYKQLIYNTLYTNMMKANNKLAPMSCYCKLSVLIPHLKSLSAKKTAIPGKDLDAAHNCNGTLFKRYI